MENAVDAIVMAGEVLIFIVALTVCISSLNTLKTTLDNIIGEDETIALASYTEAGTSSIQYANYIASKQNNATRIVKAETVVTSMYRASKEEYTLYIKFDDANIDIIENNISISDEVENKFITASYAIDANGDGTNDINVGDKLLMVGKDDKQKITEHLNEFLKNGLYDIIKNCTGGFYEYLGEYKEATNSNSANTTAYRIITYIQK